MPEQVEIRMSREEAEAIEAWQAPASAPRALSSLQAALARALGSIDPPAEEPPIEA